MGKPRAEQDQKFDDTPEGWARRWTMEFEAARQNLEPWQLRAEKIVKRFKCEDQESSRKSSKLNLHTANVQTLRALLYGKTPTVTVGRRFHDANDNVARVAGEMLERLLNTDIERAGDTYQAALENALSDRLLGGMGSARQRYVVEYGMDEGTPAKTKINPATGRSIELAAAIDPQEVMTREDVETDYAYWRDQLWSPCRVFSEGRWWAFKASMPREEVVSTFGEEVGNAIPLNAKRASRKGSLDAQEYDPWSRADVWEIWDKEHRKRWHFVEGYPRVIAPTDGVEVNEDGSVSDPYELEGFWPFPRPMFANLTTSGLIPVPDFVIAQDLYDEVDEVSTRITMLEKAIKVAGVYDKTAKGVQKLLTEACGNELIPVDNWSLFAEKGGIKGQVDWLPLEMIVAAMDKLREYRTELMELLYQVTGMSDIIRGQATTQTTATEQAIKARFASVRVQSLQDEFARFASELQRIKAELISKHFEIATIIERSNIKFTADAQHAEQAAQLIKSRFFCYRVEVKPDSVSLTDYAALKQERTEIIGALGQYFANVVPAVGQAMGPGALAFVMQTAQWMLSGMKGATMLEGVFEQAIAMAKQMQAQTQAQQQAAAANGPPPDPKIQAQQMKSEGDHQRVMLEHHADLERIGAETQAEITKQAAQAHFDMRSMEAQERLKALQGVNAVTDRGGGQQ